MMSGPSRGGHRRQPVYANPGHH
jgi:envelope integrity protein A